MSRRSVALVAEHRAVPTGRSGRAVWLAAALLLTGCAAGDNPAEDGPLRSEYAAKTAGQTVDGLYRQVVWINTGVGAASQLIPGLHIAGVAVDAAVLLHYFDELIYGTGAIVARERECPGLLQKSDYRAVLGAWFHGVRTSGEFESMMGLAATLTPLVTNDKAAQLFTQAIQLHGAKFIGAKLAGVVVAKVGAKGVAGFVPVAGPAVAAGINWYLLNGIGEAAASYYATKVQFVCVKTGKK